MLKHNPFIFLNWKLRQIMVDISSTHASDTKIECWGSTPLLPASRSLSFFLSFLPRHETRPLLAGKVLSTFWKSQKLIINDITYWSHRGMCRPKEHSFCTVSAWKRVYIITPWEPPEKGMQKSKQNRNVEAKNRESNRTVIIAINREFD